jgi:hypothetical protein
MTAFLSGARRDGSGSAAAVLFEQENPRFRVRPAFRHY